MESKIQTRGKIRSNSWHLFLAASAAICLISGCGDNGDHGQSDTSAKSYNFTLAIYGGIGNPFWAKVTTGAQEAATQTGSSVTVQFANNDPLLMNNILDLAVASGTDGIGVVIDQDGAYDDTLRYARSKNIPVISFNIDAGGGSQSGRQAFVGQDFETAGYLLGQTVIEHGSISADDQLLCPVEHPEATYAQKRFSGVSKALEEVGARCEMLGVGAIGVEDALTKIAQYLLGHPETAAVVSLGSIPTEATPKALREVGSNIPNVGFDVSEPVLQDILDGRTHAVVDQQPFLQGYFTVTQLFYAQRYGMTPVDINTGAAIIDAENAASALEWAGEVR